MVSETSRPNSGKTFDEMNVAMPHLRTSQRGELIVMKGPPFFLPEGHFRNISGAHPEGPPCLASCKSRVGKMIIKRAFSIEPGCVRNVSTERSIAINRRSLTSERPGVHWTWGHPVHRSGRGGSVEEI